MKKIIIMLILVICGAVGNVYAENDIVFYRNFENNSEIPGGIDKCYMEGDYSWSTGKMYTGLGGKSQSDYSLGISVDGYSGQYVTGKKDGNPYYIIHTGTVTNSAVIKCSMYSSGYDADTYFGANINGYYRMLFEMKEGGNIYLGGNFAGQWKKNRWYEFCADINFETSLCDFYVNGTKVLSDMPIKELGGNDIEYIKWPSAGCKAESYATDKTPVYNVSAFDDIKIWHGDYNGNKAKLPEYIRITGDGNVSEVLQKLQCENPVIYTNSALEQECGEYVNDGAVLTYTAKDSDSMYYSEFYKMDMNTVYECTENTISIPQNTSVKDFWENTRISGNNTALLVNDLQTELAHTDMIYDNSCLIIKNISGYTKKYQIKTPNSESRLILKSSMFLIDNDKNIISGITRNTNSNMFISLLSAQNKNIKLTLTEEDGVTPVFNKTVSEDMKVKINAGGKEEIYSLKYNKNTYQNGETECSDMKFYYTAENGKTYEKKSVSPDITSAHITVKNNAAAEKTISFIGAEYDDDFNLKAIVNLKTEKINSGEEKDVLMDIPKFLGSGSMSFYLWEKGTLYPLKNSETYSIEQDENPSSEELKALFSNKSSEIHPRVMAKQSDFERIAENIQSNEQINEWNGRVISEADKICANITNSAENKGSKYYIGYTSEYNAGLQILEISRRVKNFVLDLSMAYRMTGNEKYSECVWKIFQYTGKQNTSMSQWGFTDWDPNHFLDTAEMAGGYAIGYDWCYDAFTPEQREYIEQTVKEYAIDIVNDVNSTKTWYKKDTANWNIVCNGGMLLTAMAFCDVYPDACFDLMAEAINSMKYALSTFNPDGAWQEGGMYALYALEYLTKADSALNTVFGTDFEIMDIGGVSEALDYMYYLDGPEGVNNYNDSDVIKVSSPAILYMSSYFKKPVYTAYLNFERKNRHTYGGVLDMLWYKPEYNEIMYNPDENKYFGVNEFVSMGKDAFDFDKGWLSFQGGFSQNGHGHLDTGSFVYDDKGIRWICDLGSESYSLDGYFSDKRYQYYRARTEGHNTIVINPDLSGGQDIDAYSPIIDMDLSNEKPYAILDMSGCYKENADSVIRKFEKLGNDIKITDKAVLKSKGTVYLFLHTQADVELIDKNTVMLSKNGIKKAVRVYSDNDFTMSVTDALPLSVTDPELADSEYPNPADQNKNKGYKKITIKLKNTDKIDIDTVISDMKDNLKAETLQLEYGQLEEYK